MTSNKFTEGLKELSQLLGEAFSNLCNDLSLSYTREYKPQNKGLMARSQSCTVQTRPLTIYSGFGVGIYQGERVAIRKWVGGTSHYMVVQTLLPQDLSQISSELILELRDLLHFLEERDKQPYELKMDLQKKDEQV